MLRFSCVFAHWHAPCPIISMQLGEPCSGFHVFSHIGMHRVPFFPSDSGGVAPAWHATRAVAGLQGRVCRVKVEVPSLQSQGLPESKSSLACPSPLSHACACCRERGQKKRAVHRRLVVNISPQISLNTLPQTQVFKRALREPARCTCIPFPLKSNVDCP